MLSFGLDYPRFLYMGRNRSDFSLLSHASYGTEFAIPLLLGTVRVV